MKHLHNVKLSLASLIGRLRIHTLVIDFDNKTISV